MILHNGSPNYTPWKSRIFAPRKPRIGFLPLAALGFIFAGWTQHPLHAQTNPAATAAGPPDLLNIAPPDTEKPAAVKFSFPIAEGVGYGDSICIPVTIAGEEHLFCVDTGMERTAIDSKLAAQLGHEVAAEEMRPIAGAVGAMQQILAPPIKIDGKVLRNIGARAIAMNLAPFRQLSGHSMDGILGMDVLCNYVVRIDFKSRKIEIGDLDLDKDPGAVFPLEGAKTATQIAIHFFDIPNSIVELDTGCSYNGTIVKSFLKNFSPDELTTNDQSIILDASGAVNLTNHTIRRKWSLAGLQFDALQMNEGRMNLLGLAVLSNYIITFDFPNRRVYLKSLAAACRDKTVHNLTLTLDEDHIHLVFPSASIASQGVQPNDELLQINGKKATTEEVWAIQSQIDHAQTVALKIRRDNQTRDLTIRLVDP